MSGPKSKTTFKQKMTDLFIPRKGDSSRQRASKILAIAAAVLILAALILCVMLIRKYVVKDINNIPAKDYPPASSEEIASGTSASSGEEDDFNKELYVPEPLVLDPKYNIMADFVDLYETNSDVVGYVRVNDTKIDTAVVQGEDNAFYLNHTIEKKYNAFGVPYVDYRARIEMDYQSDNITIYGHAARDGDIFGAVKEYSDIEYYKKHPYLTFDTIYGKGEYKIIGAFLARVYTDATKQPDPEEFNYHQFVDDTSGGQEFNDFIKGVYARSYFLNEDVDVSYGDKLVTLSTCDSEINAFGAPTDYRRVLVARKMRQGEVKEVDVSKAVINENMLMPKAWQDKFGKENPYK